MSYFQVISYFSVKRYLKSETQLKETSAYLASCFLSIQIHRGSDYMMPEVWGGWPHCTQIMKPRRHVSRLLMLCSLFPLYSLKNYIQHSASFNTQSALSSSSNSIWERHYKYVQIFQSSVVINHTKLKIMIKFYPLPT